MNFEKLGGTITALRSWEAPISCGADAMDLIASVRYETGCESLILPKAALHEVFFRLATGLAGEVLQKFVNYNMKVAIVGEFSHYTSKPLQDFIRESNREKKVCFAGTQEEALERLGG